MYSRRNSALLRRRRVWCCSVSVPMAVEGAWSWSDRKENTWSSRRSQRRARETRCGVEENWMGVGGERYCEMRLDPMSEAEGRLAVIGRREVHFVGDALTQGV